MIRKYIITKGSGSSDYVQNAFDNALLASGVADYNLVKISSILPPRSIYVNLIDLPKGSYLHTAYSSYIERCPGKTISAAISIAIPRESSLTGVIMEAGGEYDLDTAEDIVVEMGRIAMASRNIKEYDIQKAAISMRTIIGFNCVFAAVSIW